MAVDKLDDLEELEIVEESIVFDRDHTETEITGKIVHLYFTSDNFTAGIIQADNGPLIDRDVRFAFPGLVNKGDIVTLTGAWRNDPKYKWQFKATSLIYPMPVLDSSNSTDGLANYLANNPSFKGIGPAKAKLIADNFGDNFDSIIREDPELVATTAKLKLETVLNLQAVWIERTDINNISTWLANFGLTHSQIKKIAECYGNRAKSVLEKNPYILCKEVSGFGFGRTDEVALKMGIPKEHPGRIAACLVYLVLQEAEQGGHTYIDRKTLIKNAIAKLTIDNLNAELLIREQLRRITTNSDTNVGELGEPAELVEVKIDGRVLIALPYLYKRELDIYTWISNQDNQSNFSPRVESEQIPDLILAAASSTGADPSDSQCAAVEIVLNNRISIISGSAGTGKSYTIALIYRLYNDLGLDVGMCAPTGKAAKRMSQLAAGADAKTIHRLLEYNPATNSFNYNAERKLPYDLIIIDEASMIDINLLWHLFSAVNWKHTQVLCVGDYQQLPPIGAGNFLRDAIDRRLVPCCILKQCFRSAGELKLNCNAIIQGVLKPSTKKTEVGTREWWVVDNQEDSESLIKVLRQLMVEKFSDWGFDPISDTIIIAPQNRGKLGVNRINTELQRVWQRVRNNIELPEIDPAIFNGKQEPSPRMMIGDRIIQTQNDYKINTMNGTLGIIADIRDEVTPNGKVQIYVIDFEDQRGVEIEAGSDQAKNVTLAYAVTIHKAQGSEWPCVVSIIHSANTYMLTRSLLYTAATRARKSSIIIGNRIGMRRAIRNTKHIDRRTFLGLTLNLNDAKIQLATTRTV